MKHFYSKTLVCLTSLLATFGVPNAAEAVILNTTITPDADISFGSTTVDQINFSASTSQSSGTVDATDLNSWTIDYLNNGSSVFTDTVISSGTVQDLGNASRTQSDIDYQFDIDNEVLGQPWDSGLSIVGNSSTFALATQASSFGSSVTVANNIEEGDSQNFDKNSETIPFHIDILPGVGVLGGLIVFHQYRKRRKFARSASS